MEWTSKRQQLLDTLSVACKVMKTSDAQFPYYRDRKAFDRISHVSEDVGISASLNHVDTVYNGININCALQQL